MKILCVNYEYPPLGGGGGIVCRGLAEQLVRTGYSIDVVTSGAKSLPAYEETEGVRIHRVKCIRLHKHYVTAAELLTMLLPAFNKALELSRKNNYVLNHTHFIIPSGMISYMLWKKTGLPYLITAHGSDVPGYNPDRFGFLHKLISGLWHTILTNSSALVAPSKFLAGMIKKKADIPVTLIPNGHELSPSVRDNKVNRILVVARMFERKGVQFLLKAVSDLKSDWEIVVAGDGPYLPAVKNMSKNIIPRIKFPGFIRGQELANLYQSSKIFVFPSIQENFPVVLLEAMHYGCAVITTDTDGCAEVIGGAGIKTEPGNAAQIRTALDTLMNNASEIEKFASLGYKRAGEFTWAKIALKYDELFKRHQKKISS